MGIKVLYHNACFDGFGAAWSAFMRLGASAEYIPMNYDSPLPAVDEKDMVYLLDYCRKADDIVKLVLSAKNVIILDHHKTALPELEKAAIELKQWGGDVIEKLEYTLDVERSGAMLAWQYFHSGEEPPLMIHYIQDRDLWRFKMPRTRAFHAYMCTIPFHFGQWEDVHDRMNRSLTFWEEVGENVLRYHDVLVEQFCKQVNFINIFGYENIPIVNATFLFSEVPHRLLELYPDAPFAMYEYHRSGVWQYGLRSRGDVDVSELAQRVGGGGHHNAAGFERKGPEDLQGYAFGRESYAGRGMLPELGMGYQGSNDPLLQEHLYGVTAAEIKSRQNAYQPQPIHIGVDPARKSVTIHNQSDSQPVLVDPDFHWGKLPEQFHLVQPGEVFDTEDAST